MKNLLKSGSSRSVRNIVIALIAVFAIFTMVGCSSNSSSSGTDGSKSSVVDDVKNATGMGGKVVKIPTNLADFIATVEAADLVIVPGECWLVDSMVDGAIEIDPMKYPIVKSKTFYANVTYKGNLGWVRSDETGFWDYEFPGLNVDGYGSGNNIVGMIEGNIERGDLP